MVDSTNLPEVDINQIATDLNGKMDRDGVNASCPTLLSRTANSYGGVVEIWSDGYCVQTGTLPNIQETTVNLSQEYIDINYIIRLSCQRYSNKDACIANYGDKTVSSFPVQVKSYSNGAYSNNVNFRTEGYIR